MNQFIPPLTEPVLFADDIPQELITFAKTAGIVACDIETTGLNWKEEKIGTFQIYIPGYTVAVIQTKSIVPKSIIQILEDPGICKIFHHAMFDLRFIVYHWQVEPQNIACTKVAAKIADPYGRSHSLKTLLEEHFGITLDKQLQKSSWYDARLSPAQIRYAVQDVLYLPELLEALRQQLVDARRWSFAEASFAYLSTRVHLDILGAEDVFKY